MKITAVIPARKGSKRIKNKNILKLGGHPLMAWTIKAALASNIYSEVIVTTDCKKISNIAKKYGASVPFLRSKKLSSDNSTSVEVLLDVINRLSITGSFCLLQPTSPFRNAHHIKRAAKNFKSNHYKNLISVYKGKPFNWSLFKGIDSKLKPIKLYTNKNKLNTEKTFYPNGAMYFGVIENFKQDKNFLNNSTYGYEMKIIDSLDIDLEDEFLIAKSLVNCGIKSIDL